MSCGPKTSSRAHCGFGRHIRPHKPNHFLLMPKRSPLTSAEAALRKAALAFPQATEDFPWGHRAFKVKKKMFLILSFDKDIFNVTMKLPVTGRQALALPFAEPTGYGLGKSGWVTASFGPKDKVPV